MALQFGRYSWRSLAIALIGLVSLIVLLTVPFAKQSLDVGENSPPDQTHDYDDMKGQVDEPLREVETILAGAILTLIGGVLLVALGYLPVPTGLARYGGWLAGLVAGIGLMLQMVVSTLHWGASTGVTLSNWFGSPPVSYYAISPVITGAFAAVGLYAVLSMMPMLTKLEHRDEATRRSRFAMIAGLTLFLGLLLPWAMRTSEAMNPFTEEKMGPSFHTMFGFLSGNSEFAGMYSFAQLMIAVGFIAVIGTLLSQFGIFLRGTPGDEAAKVLGAVLDVIQGVLFVAFAIFYLNAITWLFHPGWGEAQFEGETYMPAFFNFALLPLMYFWGANVVPRAMRAWHGLRGGMVDERVMAKFRA